MGWWLVVCGYRKAEIEEFRIVEMRGFGEDEKEAIVVVEVMVEIGDIGGAKSEEFKAKVGVVKAFE